LGLLIYLELNPRSKQLFLEDLFVRLIYYFLVRFAKCTCTSRARAAAALARSSGNLIIGNHFDPNAPQPTGTPRDPTKEVKTGCPWSTLDIGGMNIRNVSLSLFRYSFLTMLYLNHNCLSNLPTEIERLRSLILLDVSGNKLTFLPTEIGMLTNLQCLYLFDNMISSLPWELGNLYQLESLGVEGNPIPDQPLSIIQKDGTQALISYLRDQAPGEFFFICNLKILDIFQDCAMFFSKKVVLSILACND
jgi:CCR4-NOT transcription complex subunit 6